MAIADEFERVADVLGEIKSVSESVSEITVEITIKRKLDAYFGRAHVESPADRGRKAGMPDSGVRAVSRACWARNAPARVSR